MNANISDFKDYADDVLNIISASMGIPKKILEEPIKQYEISLKSCLEMQRIDAEITYYRSGVSFIIQKMYFLHIASKFFNGNCIVKSLK